jgi:hypothetical protein
MKDLKDLVYESLEYDNDYEMINEGLWRWLKKMWNRLINSIRKNRDDNGIYRIPERTLSIIVNPDKTISSKQVGFTLLSEITEDNEKFIVNNSKFFELLKETIESEDDALGNVTHKLHELICNKVKYNLGNNNEIIYSIDCEGKDEETNKVSKDIPVGCIIRETTSKLYFDNPKFYYFDDSLNIKNKDAKENLKKIQDELFPKYVSKTTPEKLSKFIATLT